MILEQHYLSCLAQASYFIADQASGTGVVVDPRRDIELYLERARELGVEIKFVILTHLHADFLAGHLELAQATGATIALGAKAQPDYAARALHERDVIEFGDVRIEVLETPGHTPEGISLTVYDKSASRSVPHAVLTGDTLFIGDVGRPDLVASKGLSASELASMLYDSLRDKLMPLPDETILYPGHGAGSACGKNLSSATSSTIGEQKRLNYALQPMDKAEFIAVVTAELSAPPAYFPMTAAMNQQEHATLDTVMASALAPLSLEELLERQGAGAQVLDTRHKDAFAAGHLAGSISLGLDGKFASWAGAILDLGRAVVLVGEPGAEREAALRLGRIGFDRVVGYLALDVATLPIDQLLTVARTDVRQLAGDATHTALVVDIRTPTEFANGHLPGSLSLPLAELAARRAELPTDRPLILQCQTGYRSMIAASLLEADLDVVDLAGGFEAWSEAGAEVVVEAGACSN